MPRKKSVCPPEMVSEHVRIAVDVALKNFISSEHSELEFPSSLNASEREHIHKLARKLGLCSKSRGKKSNRFLTVYKRERSTIVQTDAQFQLSGQTRQIVYNLLNKFPLSSKERQDLLPQTERDRIINPESLRERNRALGRLPAGMAQVPPPPGCNQTLQAFRQALPIWSHRDELIRTIISNQVCIIQGETGSGKTTQVPQFILEHCRVTGKKCRMIVTEPRRIAAVNVCERVCFERDEKMGQNVGYQIRLESRISPMTVLTFCTCGVLLRTLMCGESAMANVTHIILDEVHERDRYCDFLLIILRDLLAKFRNLHLILMSATLDTDIFSKYFMNCPVVSIPGKMFNVKEYFLEDVLKQTNYMCKKMVKVKEELHAKNVQKENLQKWEESINNFQKEVTETAKKSVSLHIADSNGDNQNKKSDLEPSLAERMDRALAEAFLTGTDESMAQLLQLILSENVSADYQHSETAMTALMVAGARNSLNTIEQLLLLGASVWKRASNDKTALDWANFLNHKEAAELIQSYSDQSIRSVDDAFLVPKENCLSQEDKELLDIYHMSFDDENIDVDLLMALLIHIHCTQPKGAILVFLSGYDDIVTTRDRINAEEKKLSDHMKFMLFLLHSDMQTGEQRKVFRSTPHNVRKIILSTNIAETSLNIDDVVYVIDSGKVKEKSFDALTNVSGLHRVWISQACAKQRKGRAGRTQPGVCYHLFSSVRYSVMEPQRTPELLRVPLQELCLQSKLLAPPNTPIAEFLSKAIEAPPFLVTRNAVQHLKTIDALDPWEDLTKLGIHLLDIPVEPRLGKMLMYSCVLKCLDPVLTIVCCLAYRDPFILPPEAAQKRELHLVRQKFAAGSFSDHMVLLRAFQGWQQARSYGWEKRFCEKNFISSATMEMVTGMRAQLLAQLRASGFVRSRAPGDIRDLNSNSENWAVVKAALCAGLYPNLARVDRDQAVIRTKKVCKVEFHSTSTLRELPKTHETSIHELSKSTVNNLPTDWIMYEEMSRSGRFCSLRTCTLVSPLTVAIFSGPSRLPLENVCEAEGSSNCILYRPDGLIDPDSDSETEEKTGGQMSTLKIDDWVLFKIDAEAAQLAMQLRQKWHSLFLRKMKVPERPWTSLDDAVVKTVVSVLSAEEQALNLTQPQGVGQRPRPCNIEHVKDDDFFSSNQNFLFSEKKAQKKPNEINNICNSPTSSQSASEGSEPKSNTCISESIPSNKKYFVIKAPSTKAIENCVGKKCWTFTPNTEKKINKVLKDGKEVYIVFSVQNSGHFHGVAKLVNQEDQSLSCNQLPLQWVKRGYLSFQASRHLVNPLNENRRVQSSRDGQELEASVGAALCSLWDKLTLNKANNSNNQKKLNDCQAANRISRGFHALYRYDSCQLFQRNQE